MNSLSFKFSAKTDHSLQRDFTREGNEHARGLSEQFNRDSLTLRRLKTRIESRHFHFSTGFPFKAFSTCGCGF